MFGRIVRAGALVVGVMLLASAWSKVWSVFKPQIAGPLGSDHMLVTSLSEINQEFVAVGILSILVMLAAGAVVEAKVG